MTLLIKPVLPMPLTAIIESLTKYDAIRIRSDNSVLARRSRKPTVKFRLSRNEKSSKTKKTKNLKLKLNEAEKRIVSDSEKIRFL